MECVVNHVVRFFPDPKMAIIRPGCSRLLEFEKKKDSTGRLIETFSKYPDQVV